MTVKKPGLYEDIEKAGDFSKVIADARTYEIDIKNVEVSGAVFDGADLTSLGFAGVSFRECKFTGCDFSRSNFVDVAFTNCDLSNSVFEECYFNRCEFFGCKGAGSESYLVLDNLDQVLYYSGPHCFYL